MMALSGCKTVGSHYGLYGYRQPAQIKHSPDNELSQTKVIVAKPVLQDGIRQQRPQNTYPYPTRRAPDRFAQANYQFPQAPVASPAGFVPRQNFQNQNFQNGLGNADFFSGQPNGPLPAPPSQLPGGTFQVPGATLTPGPTQVPPNVVQPGFTPSTQPFPGQVYYPAVPQGAPIIVTPGMTPDNTLDVDVIVPPTTGTGKLSIGGTYGSDNDLVGQIIIDERDFDFRRWPRSLRDAFGPTAWRGAGQHFRLEIVPGTELERYLVSISFPYVRNSQWSLGLSGYYHDRRFDDWDEERVGARISLGRPLSEFLSFNAGIRAENVEVDNPRVGTSPQLNASLGDHELYLLTMGLVYDSRVAPFFTPEGSYLGFKFSQGFGDFTFSKGEVDFRHHRMMYQRPDFSGRHTLGYRTKLGFASSDTPVWENFIAGGLSSMRGFDFRGVSPIDGGVRVGGEFQWLNSLEYLFPLTQDDMIYGTMFVDFGTVEEDIEINSENFRVAPGVGLRVNLPFAGLGGAPFAIDFAFPVSDATGDDQQTVSFYIGALR